MPLVKVTGNTLVTWLAVLTVALACGWEDLLSIYLGNGRPVLSEQRVTFPEQQTLLKRNIPTLFQKILPPVG